MYLIRIKLICIVNIISLQNHELYVLYMYSILFFISPTCCILSLVEEHVEHLINIWNIR